MSHNQMMHTIYLKADNVHKPIEAVLVQTAKCLQVPYRNLHNKLARMISILIEYLSCAK